MKNPDPPPPGGKNYAENKAILKAREDAEKAGRLGYEQGYKFGKTLGDAQEGLKTLNSSTGGRFERTLETNPKLVEELQANMDRKVAAQTRYETLKAEYEKLRSTPNKTPELKATMEKTER